MTMKSAYGVMTFLTFVIAAMFAFLLYSVAELNIFAAIGIPLALWFCAAGFLLSRGQVAAKADAKEQQERADADAALADKTALLEKTEVAHKKQSAESVTAIAALEADLTELVSLMDAILAGDFTTAKRVRLRGTHSRNASSFASGMAEICTDLQGVATTLVAGDLKRALNTDKYRGDWNKLTLNINRGLADAAAVVTQAKAVCDGFAQGILSGKVDADARGDLQALKTAVNNATQNLSKYTANIGEAIQREGQRGKGFLEMPGDFAYLKSVISTAISGSTAPATPIRATASTQPAISRTSGARAVVDGASRFSGAPKVSETGRNATFDFNRKDFGKY